jgi:hypothetical protein
MKTRNGFVSNSSSSSYIVRIKDTKWDEFCDIVTREKGWYFEDELLGEVNAGIEKCNKSIETANANKDDALSQLTLHTAGKWLKELTEIKGILESEETNKLTEAALKFNGIKFNEYQDESGQIGVELMDFAAMHNSFNEGMNDLMKEIVLSFMFDTDKQIECEREDDDMLE